jgi:4-amino-4-deoxy-L-arabinose transferase-like glycosyltransferase
VQLWPESSRPWIGGSQHNSFLELALGYNGLGRLNGDEVGSTIEKMNETGFLAEMKACAAPGFSDPFEPGWSRLVSQDNGGQIGWLLPAALLLAAVSFVLVGRARRTDPRRAQLIAWTGWLVVSGAVFSAMRGIFHPYYTVALAPPVAALVGIGLTLLWAKRERWWARASLVSTVLVTAGTAWTVLGYDDDFLPWLRWAIMGVAIVAAFGLFFLAGKSPQSRSGRVLTSVPVLLGFASALAGPAAFVENTLEHSGEQSAMGLPFAGPVPSSWYYSGWNYPQFLARVEEGCFGGPAMLAERAQMQERWAERGSAGGLLGPAEPDPELVAMLRQNADAYTWVAATVGSSPAAGYQLSTRPPVMPLGGFNGSDPFPTFEQFQRYVAEHRMHYYLAPDDETMDEFAPSDSVKAIHHWAKERFTLVRAFDSVEVYDLTKPKS